MPCSDGNNEEFYSRELESKNNELTVLLCSAIGMLTGESRKTDRNKTQLMAWYKKHRQHDRETAVSEAKRELADARRKAKQIVALGGTPGDSILAKIEELQEKVTKIANSDPMNTDDY
jgi:hypothetical protein